MMNLVFKIVNCCKEDPVEMGTFAMATTEAKAWDYLYLLAEAAHSERGKSVITSRGTRCR